MDADLQALAKARAADPMNTWPDHNKYHRRTLMNNWLFDHDCLRCWLEKVATQALKASETEQLREEGQGGGYGIITPEIV